LYFCFLNGNGERFRQEHGRIWNKKQEEKRYVNVNSKQASAEVESERQIVGTDVNMGVAAKDDLEGAEEISNGLKCTRCTKKGHLASNCTAVLYCVICDVHNEHMNHRCPLLKAVRPVAHAVGYAVHGLGFYHIPHPPLSRANKESKLALIKVEGGQLSSDR
jgi:hypothetical protein